MKRVEVEAVEDRSRAEGGYAVILVRDVAKVPDPVRFGLSVIDSDAPPMTDLRPIASNLSGDEIALVVGPDVTSRPELVPGAVVELSWPDAGVYGEFLWPAVMPIVQAKRRNIMIRKAGAAPVEPAGSLAHDPIGQDSSSALPRRRLIEAGSGSRSAGPEKQPATGAVPALPIDAILSPGETAHEPMGQAKAGANGSVDNPPEVHDVGRVADSAPNITTDDAAAPLSPVNPIVAEAGAAGDFATPPHLPSHKPPRSSVALAAATAVAIMLGLQIVALYALDLRFTRPAAPQLGSSTAHGAPSIATEQADRRGLYDVLATGPQSPRGQPAVGVSAARALQLAHSFLHGPAGSRDHDEGIYWLKRYVLGTSGTDHARIALTQLGSAYAQPVRGQRDFLSAKVAWELASALGDPVAMCFLAAMHDQGLGVPASMATAQTWYQRATVAGRSCASAEASSGSDAR